MKPHSVWTTLILIAMIAAISLVPAQAAITFGRWRDINPTQYSTDVTGTLRGTYIRDGGSGAIGAGDGWVVGGDGSAGIIAHYDGFSWQVLAPPVPSAVYYSTHFCVSPGAPNVGSICSPNGDGSDGWFVGSVGGTTPVASYWNGASLTEVDEGLAATGASNLTSVFVVCHSPAFSIGCSGPFATAGLTYAVGQSSSYGLAGIICYFAGAPTSGGSWNCNFKSTKTDKYNSVYMYVDQSGNLGGFAVGDNGVIAQFSSGAWTDTQPAPGVNFRSVFVDQGGSNLEAWAVGDAFTNQAEIWHFCCGPAGSWSGPVDPNLFAPGPAQNLESVFLVSSSEGWIVGSSGVILHSTTLGSSNQWLELTQPSQTAVGAGFTLIGLSFPSSGNGWAVGTSGVIINTQNSNCGNAVQAPCWGGNTDISETANLTSVFEVSTSDVWAGGAYDFANFVPTLIHWDGQKWHRAQILPPSTLSGKPFNIAGVFMSGSSDGWAVGGAATCSPTCVPFAIHWDGNSWSGSAASQPTCPGGCMLTSLFMINSGEGWAVGTGGTFFHYTTSVNQWALVAGPPTTVTFRSVDISNPGNNQNAGFAVGDAGTIAELSISGGAATWNIIHPLGFGTTLTPNLYGVFFTDSNHGWIVGAQGTILATTDGGVSWSGGEGQVAGAPTAALRSVYVDQYGVGSGNGDGWAVGGASETGSSNAVFAHWDGEFWTATTISPPIAPGLALNSVYGQSGNAQEGWAVGAGPTGVTNPLAGIFHLDPLSPPIVGQQNTSSTSSNSNSLTSNTTLSTASTATNASTTSTATSNTATTASVSASLSTVTVVSTPTPTTASVYTTVSISTPVALPAIPGFSWESIIAGLMLGITALAIVRRRKK